jgi:hypothetical protein
MTAVGGFDPVPLGILPPQRADPMIELLFVDVADPAQPRIERRLKIEGFKLAVRRISARIHVISHLTPVMHTSISSDERVLDLRERYVEATARKDAAADQLAAEIRARASGWRKFLYITLPMLSPVIFFNLIMQMISGFLVFTQALIITNGGPLDTTLFYALYLYQRAFVTFQMGYGTAMAWVLLLIIALFTAVAFKFSSYWVFYEEEGF